MAETAFLQIFLYERLESELPEWVKLPSFQNTAVQPQESLLAEGGIPQLRNQGLCPADSAYPTLRQVREGWGTRSLVVTEKRKRQSFDGASPRLG
jgi:hypothetical protein